MSDIGINRPPSHLPLDIQIGAHREGARVETPTQRQVASAKLTPLPTPQPLPGPKSALLDSAIAKSGSAGKNTCPSRKEVAQRKLGEASEKMADAKKVGVDVAKQSFFRKMVSVAFQAVAVGIAAGLTAISLGGAAPVLALACASLVNSIGDAACAYRGVKNAEAVAEGREPPYKLPGGNSFMGNVGFAIAKGLNASDETAAKVGKAMGVVVGMGLAVGGVVASLGMAAPSLAVQVASNTASSLNVVTQGYSALGASMSSDMDKDHIDNLSRESGKLANSAKELDSDVDVAPILKQARDAENAYKLASGNQELAGTGAKTAGFLFGMVNKLT